MNLSMESFGKKSLGKTCKRMFSHLLRDAKVVTTFIKVMGADMPNIMSRFTSNVVR